MRFLKTLRTLIDDRLLIMLLPALLIIVTDRPVLFSLAYAVAIVVAIVAVAHSLRLLLLPYVSLGKLIEQASQAPMPAAVVFTSVLIFMGLIVHAMVAWIQAAAGR